MQIWTGKKKAKKDEGKTSDRRGVKTKTGNIGPCEEIGRETGGCKNPEGKRDRMPGGRI